ncbi:MAG: hypothetical protein N2512_10200, partial [Armatimonadetes bacterium]|nr:hypothetical protein [Armatimonadota bacterium]
PDGSWRREILEKHPEWLLSTEPLPGPPGTSDAYYYDLAQPEAARFLAERATHLRRLGHYAGIFFDYAGEYALPDEVRRRWEEKNAGLPYDIALAGFFAEVRRADPACLIFSNGACLGAAELRRAVDYDLVESYGTSYLWGPTGRLGEQEFPLTYRRPWHGPAGLKETFSGLMDKLAAARPRKDLFCLDYMRAEKVYRDGLWHDEADVEAVYYSYCAAAVWGLKSYCSGWDGVEYRGPLYFVDLGRPLGEGPVEQGGAVVREYERAVVVLTTSAEPTKVELRLRRLFNGHLYDLRIGRQVRVSREGKVVLRLRPERPAGAAESQAVGRVFLKVVADDSLK